MLLKNDEEEYQRLLSEQFKQYYISGFNRHTIKPNKERALSSGIASSIDSIDNPDAHVGLNSSYGPIFKDSLKLLQSQKDKVQPSPLRGWTSLNPSLKVLKLS